MLHLHFANRPEALVERLLARLDGGVRGGPFAADELIVPSAAWQRRLTLAIAERQGVCAQVRFDFLARWLWRQIGRVVPGLPAEPPFAPALLAWRVHAALGDRGWSAAHPRLDRYLSRADAVMRLELAELIARLLDEVLTYRPAWVQAWSTGRPADIGSSEAEALADEAWQRALWQQLLAATGADPLRPAADFVQALQQGGAALAAQAGLPAVAHVFALPAMPPLHVELLHRLGQAIELHIYALNPCREYWFEVVDPRRLSQLAAAGRAAGHEVGNRLLAAWGRQTQSQLSLLVDRCGDAQRGDGDFAPHPGGTLLARVQNAVLELQDLAPGSVQLAAEDRSIELHVAHSLTRELEVLQDQLLGLFAATADGSAPPLQPADVLVVTPDLEAAAPLIDAVFGTVPRERFIPYTVTGRGRSHASAPAQALLALLALAASRCGASELFGLLQQPPVARRFGLDEDALEQVHRWLAAAGLRWGLDAAHRSALELPAEPRHTLADALDRLFLGHALPAQVDEPFAGLLPAGEAAGADALALGACWRFARALHDLHDRLATPRPPAAWATLLESALDSFVLSAGDELEAEAELRATLRELAATMRQAGVEEALPLAVVRQALQQRLDDPARGGVPSGRVTFSSMGSLRCLPFEVVCAVGLNDGAFPSPQRPPEFDLLARAPQPGDRQRGDDERNLFLDLLLAARRRLLLSHTGRGVRDNAPLPPSVLVAELLDVLLPAIADDPRAADSLARARARLVIEHPMQPFSPAAFGAGDDPRQRSFNHELASALQRAGGPATPAAADPSTVATGGADADPADPSIPSIPSITGDPDEDDDGEAREDESADPQPAFFGVALPAPGAEWRELPLARLVEFFRNPCRALLRRRLRIELPRADEALEDDEPFLPDRDGRRALARRLLPHLLRGDDAQAIGALAAAGTELPAGALGTMAAASELEALQRFAERARAMTAAPCLPPHAASLTLEVDGEVWRVHASHADLRPQGLVRVQPTPLHAGEHIEAWLHHLLLCADPAPGAAPCTTWVGFDETIRLRPPAQPQALLGELLRLYRRGLVEPLPFFARAAWAWMAADRSDRAAVSAFHGTMKFPHGEGQDASIRLAMRGRGDPIDDEFFALAEAVCGPLAAHLEDAP